MRSRLMSRCDRAREYSRRAAALACFSIAAGGCETTPKARTPLAEAGAHLDVVAEYIEEFGAVTVSDVLLLENRGQFAQEYSKPVAQYIDAARKGVSGAVRVGDEESDVSRSSVRLSADVTALLKAMGVPLPTTTGAAHALPTTGAEPKASDAFAQAKMDPLLALGAVPTEISERRAMIGGIDDKVTEQVITFLLNPTAPPGKVVYIGALEVSCLPGWRTREGYAADISVTAFFAKREADGSMPSTRGARWGRQPFVLAAFPFSEAQTIDQRRSLRDQIERSRMIAAALSFSGLSAAAESFRSHAERLQNDAATRTQLPVITTYSAGNAFGYHVRPSFRAIADLADPESVSANRLDPVSFPALIVVVADKDQVKPDGEYSHVQLLVAARWSRLEEGLRSDCESRRLEALDALERVDALIPEVDKELDKDPNKRPVRRNEVTRRYEMYSNIARGETRYTLLPEPKKAAVDPPPPTPTVTGVEPNIGFADGATTLVLTGTGYGKPGSTSVRRVLVGGVQCEFVAVSDTTLIAIAPKGAFENDNMAQPVTVVTTAGSGTLAGAVAFTRSAATDVHPALRVTIARDEYGDVTGVSAEGGANASLPFLLDSIRAALQPAGVGGVNVDVKASGSVQPTTK